MNLKLDLKKSNLHERYYHADASSITELCRSNNGRLDSERDFPQAREFFSYEFGIDMQRFQKIIQPYSHCDSKIDIFTQHDDSLQQGEAKVRLAFAFGIFEDDIFRYLTSDHFNIDGNITEKDYHIFFTASLIYDGEKPVAFEKGVIGSRIEQKSLIDKEAAAFSEVLTDLRYTQSNQKNKPVSFSYNGNDMFDIGDMKGERLYLALSPKLNLPWMIEKSRCVLEELADDSHFQRLVGMKKAILDAKQMRQQLSDDIIDTKLKPLAVIDATATAYSQLFDGNLFTVNQNYVVSLTPKIKAAVKSLNELLDAQVYGAESEYGTEVIRFYHTNKYNKLITFLRYI